MTHEGLEETTTDDRSEAKMRRQAGRPAGRTPGAGSPAPPGDIRSPGCFEVLEALPAGVAVLDAGGLAATVNAAARRLLGLGGEIAGAPLLPRRWQGSIRDEDGQALDPATWPLAALGAGPADPRTFAVRHPAFRGDRWVSVAAEPVPSADGTPGFTVVTLHDATAARQAVHELAAVTTDRDTILAAVPDTFVFVGPDDRITRVAGESEDGPLARQPARDSVVGRHPWELFDDEAAGKARQALTLARATGRPVTSELTRRLRSGDRHEEVRHVPLAGGSVLLTLRDISERKRTEEALARSEEKYRTLYTRTPVMLHSIDAEGRLLSVSDRWLRRLGYTASEVLGRPSTDFLTEASRRLAAEEILPRFFRTGECSDVPYQLVARSGEVVDVLLSAIAERDASGRVSRSLAVLIDVSAQRAAEREVARQEGALHALVDQAPILLWTLDPDMTVTSVRGGAASSAGIGPGEVVGQRLTDLVSRDSPLLPAARRALEGTPAGYEHQALGRTFSGVVQPLRDADGAVRGAVTVSHDVTEHRAAEAEIHARQEQLRLAVDQAPAVLWTVDRDLCFTSSRGGGLSALGLQTDQVVGMTLAQYFQSGSPDHPAVRAHHRALSGEANSFEMQSGGRHYVTHLEPLRDGSGAIIGVVGAAHDVTEARDAQDALREREEMLSGLVSSLPGAAYRSMIGAPWETSFISDGCREMTGYSPEELTGGGVTWAELIHPGDLHLVVADLERDLEERRDSTLSEYRVVHRDGTEHWLLDRAVIARDTQGTPVELIGLVIDITDRRSTEQALEEREAQLQGLMANMPGMAYRCEAKPPWQDEFIGSACLEMTGYTPEQLVAGVPVWEELMEPADRDRLRRETEEAAAERRPGELEYRIRTASGELRWMWDRFHVIRDEDDRPVALDGVMLDVTDRHSAEEESQRLRLHDATTGLPNRFLFTDRISQALAHATRTRGGFAVVALAVDRFSTLVDTLGHEACDRLLAAVADRLKAGVRSEDTVACLAGSEFGLLLPGVSGSAQASTTVAKVMKAFSSPFPVDSHELFLTLSAGISIYPADGAEASDVLERAEVAARRVSSQGGNGWEFFRSGMNAEQAGRLALEGELHRALEREQFVVYYQPVVDARSGAITGAEALLRWQRPEHGVAMPADFMSALEETGLSVRVGTWVIQQVCSQAQAWGCALAEPPLVAVNLSPRQLYDESLLDTLSRALAESGLPGERLALEVTETTAMRDPEEAARILTAVRALGVHVALDDFGTGYSSLSHLVRLPVVTVKIDRSFVHDLFSVPEHAAVATSVIALGHRLGLTVVAEGVETEAERDFLRAESCDGLQGFLFSKAVPAEEFTRLLENGRLGEPAG